MFERRHVSSPHLVTNLKTNENGQALHLSGDHSDGGYGRGGGGGGYDDE